MCEALGLIPPPKENLKTERKLKYNLDEFSFMENYLI
jgi:hypothetical protein